MTAKGSIRHRVQLSTRVASVWRPTGPRLRALLRSLVVSYIALGITLYLVPGRQSSGPLAVAGLVIVVAAVGVLLRPVLTGLAAVCGSFGLLVLGMVSQAIILDVAIAIAPDVDITGQPEVLAISWVAASVAAVVNWLLDAGGDDVYLNQLLGRAVRIAHQHRRATGSSDGGMLVIQLDGVGEELLRGAMTAGSLPTLTQWLGSHTHALSGWHTGLPSTTPAAQAVLLHGDVLEVPSFRWFEKETGRVVVANHPHDAAEIERRMSDGRGLLAAGGVSVSTLFSGDAPLRLATMSDAHLPPRNTHGLASFTTSRGAFARTVVLSIGTVVTELYQGARQRRRDLQPRVHRGGVFAVQRAVTTVLLHDLAIAIVAEQIARGAPAIFVDFLDFDEVAHHAGPSRPESIRTLEGLDHLVGFLAQVSHETGHAYEIAVLSDHGQAQGATFAQLAGVTLGELVSTLAAERGAPLARTDAGADSGPAERWGPANLLLTAAARSDTISARAVTRMQAGISPAFQGESTDGHVQTPRSAHAVVVVAAGSLAHLYLPDQAGRVSREDIDRLFPRLIDGLAQHGQIGAVMVRSTALGSPIAVGAHGWRVLTASGSTGGQGIDPIAVFGPHTCADLLDLDGKHHVGDVVVLGRFDPESGEVAAFEDLVGSHGGLGGAQTEAFFLHPAGWLLPSERPLHGLDVHNVLLEHVPNHVRAGRT